MLTQILFLILGTTAITTDTITISNFGCANELFIYSVNGATIKAYSYEGTLLYTYTTGDFSDIVYTDCSNPLGIYLLTSSNKIYLLDQKLNTLKTIALDLDNFPSPAAIAKYSGQIILYDNFDNNIKILHPANNQIIQKRYVTPAGDLKKIITCNGDLLLAFDSITYILSSNLEIKGKLDFSVASCCKKDNQIFFSVKDGIIVTGKLYNILNSEIIAGRTAYLAGCKRIILPYKSYIVIMHKKTAANG